MTTKTTDLETVKAMLVDAAFFASVSDQDPIPAHTFEGKLDMDKLAATVMEFFAAGDGWSGDQ